MKVSDLIIYLQKQPQDLLVAYQRFSEHCLLEEDDIAIEEHCKPRPDGWVQYKRGDKESQKYLILPGN